MIESECPKARMMVALHHAARKVELEVLEVFHRYHITPSQYGVLEVLYYKGQLSIGELTELMMATSGNMTVIIKNLVQREWVSRTCDPNDRRSSLVQLTKSGSDFVERVLPDYLAVTHRLLADLTTEELDQLTELLHKID